MGRSRNEISGHRRVRLRIVPSTAQKPCARTNRRDFVVARLRAKLDAWLARRGKATSCRGLCAVTALPIAFQSSPNPISESHQNGLATLSARVPAEIRRLPQPHRTLVEGAEVPGHLGALLSNPGASRRGYNTCRRLSERPPPSARLGMAPAAPSGPKDRHRSHADGPGYDRMKMHRTYRTNQMLWSPRVLPA